MHHQYKKAWTGKKPSKTIKNLLKKYKANIHSKILEIGCGEGQNAIYLTKKHFHVQAFDVSPSAIQWCKQQAVKHRIDENIFFVMDALHNDFSESYDFIYTVAVLHMLVTPEDRMQFLNFIYRNLNVNGKAFIIIMGDGVHEKETDPNLAFDIVDRKFGNQVVKVANTSCKIVNWEHFTEELHQAKFQIIDHYLDTKIRGFNSCMIAIVTK